ncbi:MAG: DUF4258 domain-containing protein [Candidatus Binatia bacterium]
MPRRILDRIREAIRNATYDMTVHAIEEMAEDEFDFIDIETAILNGRLMKSEKDDPRGTRYTIHGIGIGATIPVGTVGRFTETGRYLIIRAYAVMESER